MSESSTKNRHSVAFNENSTDAPTGILSDATESAHEDQVFPYTVPFTFTSPLGSIDSIFSSITERARIVGSNSVSSHRYARSGYFQQQPQQQQLSQALLGSYAAPSFVPSQLSSLAQPSNSAPQQTTSSRQRSLSTRTLSNASTPSDDSPRSMPMGGSDAFSSDSSLQGFSPSAPLFCPLFDLLCHQIGLSPQEERLMQIVAESFCPPKEQPRVQQQQQPAAAESVSPAAQTAASAPKPQSVEPNLFKSPVLQRIQEKLLQKQMQHQRQQTNLCQRTSSFSSQRPSPATAPTAPQPEPAQAAPAVQPEPPQPQTQEMAPNHQIDYDNESIKSFLQQLQQVLNSPRFCVEPAVYDHFWRMMGNRDLATVYLTVLTGKLLQLENNTLQLIVQSKSATTGERRPSVGNAGDDGNDDSTAQPRPSISDDNNQTDASDAASGGAEDLHVDVNEIITEFQLGKHQYNANHPLLLKRKENIINRNFELVVDADEDFVDNGTAPVTRRPGQKLSSLVFDKSWFTPEQHYMRMNIINSMIYMSLFYKFDFNNASLLHLIHTWTKLRAQTFQQKENGDKIDSLSEEVREELIKLPSASALYKYVQLCIDYDVMEDGDVNMPPPLNRHDPLTMVSSYAYSNLQAVARVPEFTEMILDDIILLLSKSLTENSGSRFKNCLRFIKLMLPQLYIPGDDKSGAAQKLEVIVKLLKPHLIRPLPIGGMTKDIMIYIKRELRCRGAAMRERYERSVRRTKRTDGVVVDERRLVHILFNGYAQNAGNLADRVALHNDHEKTDLDIVKANLVLNMFETTLGEEEVKPMLAVPFDTLAKYYTHAKRLLEDPNNINNKSLLVAAMQGLKVTVVNDRSSMRGEPLQQRRKSPQMPEPEFRVIELETEEDLMQCPRELKIYPRSIYVDVLNNIVKEQMAQKPDDQPQLVLDIAIAGGSGTIMHFVHSHFVAQKLKYLKDVDIRLFVIPLGENNLLSNWLEKYDGWYSRHLHYPMMSALSMLPALKTGNESSRSPSDLLNLRKPGMRGSVTSIKDKLPLSPHKTYVKKSSAAKIPQYRAPNNYLTPHKFMRTLLNEYFIDAHRPVPMYVYNAQCLCNEVIQIIPGQEDGSSGASGPSASSKQLKGQAAAAVQQQQAQLQKGKKVKEYVSLCFSQRLEIGYVAEVLQLQKTEKLDGLSLEELGQHKSFKYGGLNLVISYVPMDPTGELVRTTDIMEPAKTYHNISIQAVSSCGDKGTLVGANQPWLEVFAEEFSVTKKGKNAKGKQGASCPSSDSTNYHVGSISIESTSAQQFSVALDGEVFGPFHKILINPSTNILNLQSFSNIDLY